jgi:hypothetical protein
MIKLNIKTG